MGEAKKLWWPGESLDDEFPVATARQLVAELSVMSHGAEVVSLRKVLGAMRKPEQDEKLKAIVSIDLCEVLRKTSVAVSLTAGRMYRGGHYHDGLWNDERMDADPIYKDNIVAALVKTVVNYEHVPPVDDYREIADIIRYWREEHGIYTIANTSTLEGCELATLRTLQEFYPDCFDGIVFPRNHDGNSKITKADALGFVINRLASYGQNLDYALHVDDAPHHVMTMLEHPPHSNTQLFVPAYETNQTLHGHESIVRKETSLDVFRHMDDYVRQQASEI